MASPSKRDHGLLHRFNFPPYQVRCLNENTVLVGGGGGASKTGIPNRLELVHVSSVKTVTGSELPIVKVIGGVDTGLNAVMSFDLLSLSQLAFVLTAEDSSCVEYLVSQSEAVENVGSANRNGDITDSGEVRQRGNKNKEKETDKKDTSPPPAIADFKMQRLRSLDLALSSSESLCVNVVKMASNGRLGVAAGAKGKVIVFDRVGGPPAGVNGKTTNPASIKVRFSFDASGSGKEVEDLDISPDLTSLVTICSNPDGKYAKVWRLADVSLETELALMRPTPVTYRFKQCRYGRVPGVKGSDKGAFLLHTTHIPVVRDRKPNPCYLTVWACTPQKHQQSENYVKSDIISLGMDIPSCLAVSECGRHLAVGTLEGAVSIYRLGEGRLSRIYHLPTAHPIFVTGVAILPVSRAYKAGHIVEAVSVSADNMLRWHRQPLVPQYRLSLFWTMIVFIFLGLLVIFIQCHGL